MNIQFLIFSDIQFIGRSTVEKEKIESSVCGVTWLEDTIYVVCKDSNKVHVFPEPFDESEGEEIEIKKMKNPKDISACMANRSIYISDKDNKCVWRFRKSDGAIIDCDTSTLSITPSVSKSVEQISCHVIDGDPFTLSITPSNELIVVVRQAEGFSLDIFSCEEVQLIKHISLNDKIHNVLHAIQSSNGDSTFISYSNTPGVFQISELSPDGKDFARTLGSAEFTNIEHWKPSHIMFDEDGNFLVADGYHDRVYLINPELTDLRILINRYQHQLDGPKRLCYVPNKNQLIVGQTGSSREPGIVSVFSLRSLRKSKIKFQNS